MTVFIIEDHHHIVFNTLDELRKQWSKGVPYIENSSMNISMMSSIK